MRARHLRLLTCLSLWLCGCADQTASEGLVEVKRPFVPFQQDVYPVLLRDCGFSTCHGAADRLFRVWGPGRARLQTDGITPEAFASPTGDEIGNSYALALAMIDPRNLGESLLLTKPLSVGAGGAGHGGVDRYGRDVYRTPDDAGFRVIARWAETVPEPAVEPTTMMMQPAMP